VKSLTDLVLRRREAASKGCPELGLRTRHRLCS